MDNATKKQYFECHEPLWLAFNELAKRLNISIDGLICEAMTIYYQQQAAASQTGTFLPVSPQNSTKPYTPHDEFPAPPQRPAEPAPAGYNANRGFGEPPAPQPPMQQPMPQPGFSQPNLPGAFASNPIQNIGSHAPLPPPPAPSAQRVPPPTPPSSYRRPPSIFDDASVPPSAQKLQLASLSTPASAPVHAANPVSYQSQRNDAPANVNTGMPPLYIVFANQRYFVNKDKYIIGRSSQVADLVIRDGNISRKHCAVIYKGGAYYIKDLGSTNGIEYHGKQIDTKKIEEGDQFNVCEFYFTFTFK